MNGGLKNSLAHRCSRTMRYECSVLSKRSMVDVECSNLDLDGLVPGFPVSLYHTIEIVVVCEPWGPNESTWKHQKDMAIQPSRPFTISRGWTKIEKLCYGITLLFWEPGNRPLGNVLFSIVHALIVKPSVVRCHPSTRVVYLHWLPSADFLERSLVRFVHVGRDPCSSLTPSSCACCHGALTNGVVTCVDGESGRVLMVCF